ncbi:MAG: nucleotide exchange factor GrpE [Clostridia bacterium]|nr:nucleotide exchange factor GrpE [Clostridia bacterium]
MKKNEEKIEKEKTCESHDCGCQHGEECTCGDHCDCGDSCTCGDHCECGDECTCGEECECHKKEYDEEVLNEEAGQYLAMAQRLQADFDNYRKRVAEQLEFQKNEGKKSVIEVFLPCLDTFKEAKKSITDEKVLSGVNMIENKILDALKTLKVEKIESVGQKYDHNLHEVIAVMHDESKENDIILDEFQAGYMFNGKVIRYSKVIVNKKED